MRGRPYDSRESEDNFGDNPVKATEPTKEQKVQYVKSQKQIREHTCHWPGCGKQCKPAYWGCYSCWMRLPRYLREKIWETFKPGQEVKGTPSREYVAVAREVQEWIRENYPETKNMESH